MQAREDTSPSFPSYHFWIRQLSRPMLDCSQSVVLYKMAQKDISPNALAGKVMRSVVSVRPFVPLYVLNQHNTITFGADFLKRDAVVERYLLSSSVCQSVCHKPDLYRNDWTNRAGILERRLLSTYSTRCYQEI